VSSHQVTGDNRGILVRFLVEVRNLSVPQNIFNLPGTLAASYSMDTGDAFSGGKAAGTWSC